MARGAAHNTFSHPQREHQPFSLQCEAVYQALKMPYRILPRQLPQKELQVSLGPEVWAQGGRVLGLGCDRGRPNYGHEYLLSFYYVPGTC